MSNTLDRLSDVAEPSVPQRRDPHPGAESRPNQRRFARQETLAGYIFLLPWLLGFFGLTLLPMGYSLYLSFTSYNIFSPP
ncbi:MAG TPA: hypothetical protein VLQ67_15225, partial [Arachnia sp.]|nr:hypothetical protein [Arachnia sp.]